MPDNSKLLKLTFLIIDSTSCSVRVDNPSVSPQSSTVVAVKESNDSNNTTQCKTKLGKAVEFVLGQSREVLQFDVARQQHKRSPSDKYFLAKFMKQVALVEVRVVKEQQQIRKELGLWERVFLEVQPKSSNTE